MLRSLCRNQNILSNIYYIYKIMPYYYSFYSEYTYKKYNIIIHLS